MENVSSLTAKVDRHRAEMSRAAATVGEGLEGAACNEDTVRRSGGVGGSGGSLGGGGAFACANSTLSRCTEETASTFSDSEEDKGLLGNRQPMQTEEGAGVARTTLEIEIEQGLMSLRGDATEERDRRINPEFLDA